jgi:hypothetical protein
MPTVGVILWSVQSLQILSLTPLPPTPCFSTVFNTYPYILYLHILWYAILLIWLAFVMFDIICSEALSLAEVWCPGYAVGTVAPHPPKVLFSKQTFTFLEQF